MAATLKRSGILFSLIGPTGGGKTTFCQKLNESFRDTTEISVSVTSRAKRAAEVEGVSYHFVSRNEFEEKISQGQFFEWEEVHGNFYGTMRQTLDAAVQAGRDLLLDIDIRGALNFKKHYPHDAVNIFLVPPTFDIMVERLKGRGLMSEKELEARLSTARKEYERLFEAQEQGVGIDYFLVNDEAEATFQKLQAIVVAERQRLSRIGREAVRKICVIP